MANFFDNYKEQSLRVAKTKFRIVSNSLSCNIQIVSQVIDYHDRVSLICRHTCDEPEMKSEAQKSWQKSISNDNFFP